MHHVAWDEVDVLVAELGAHVPDALAAKLVQLGVVHPLHTLQGTNRKYILFVIGVSVISGMQSLRHTHTHRCHIQ